MGTAGMEHLTHFWALKYVTCSGWPNTFLCGCTHMALFPGKTTFICQINPRFVVLFLRLWFPQLESEEWNAHWLDETHEVRKQQHSTISVRSTWWWWWALFVSSRALDFALTGNSESEGMSTLRIYFLLLSHLLPLVHVWKILFSFGETRRRFQVVLENNPKPHSYK